MKKIIAITTMILMITTLFAQNTKTKLDKNPKKNGYNNTLYF